jgi:hypothetical protein
MEVEIWIYRGLIGFIIMVLWYVIRRWATKIDEKFDQLIHAVENMGIKNETQNGEIKMLQKVQNTQDTRLNDHSKRIREVERKVK